MNSIVTLSAVLVKVQEDGEKLWLYGDYGPNEFMMSDEQLWRH